MKILNRKMHGQRVGVLDGAVQFDDQGVAEVSDEQGAALLQIPDYSDADAVQEDGPVISNVVPDETPVLDPAVVEAEAAAAEAAAAAKASKGSKKNKE